MESFSWAIEVARADGSIACSAPLLPDWQAAWVCARFEAIRRGVLPPILSSEPGEVEPVWHDSRGEPHVVGLRVRVRAPDGDHRKAAVSEIPVSYLGREVEEAVRCLAAEGRLERGKIVYPRLCAYRQERRPLASGGEERTELGDGHRDAGEREPGRGCGRFVVEEVPWPLALVDTPMAQLSTGAKPCGLPPEREVSERTDIARSGEVASAGERSNAGDVPVFLPRRVLEEAEALSRAAGEVETGGVIVGRLHRDATLPEIFVEVTAQLPAEHTIAAKERLTFTPETWAAAQTAIAARRMEEQLVGWWHFHPDFCRHCPPERRRDCALDGAFFSADDVLLHHLCFAQAHQIALLLSARPSGALERSLYGWRHGTVAARGYYLTKERGGGGPC